MADVNSNNNEMKKKEEDKQRLEIWASIAALVAITLIVASFILPPTGVIDPSVLGGVGEIIGIIALFLTWHAVEKGIDAKITHGNTTIELTHNDDDEATE